jgi:hypothetical protein
MHKLTRKIILLGCTFLFLLITPFIVLYAIGYRAPKTEGIVPSVGVLLVESFPKRAQVNVNNENVGTTPEDITSLRPGPINIKVTKDGYIPWEKNIDIEPNQVTYLDNIRLFKEQPTVTKLASQISQFSLAPSRKLLAVADINNSVQVIDIEGQTVLEATKTFALPIQRMLWSPASSHLLVFSGQDIYTLNIFDETQGYNLLNFKKPKDIVWDPLIPDRLLIQTTKNDLIAYHITSGATSELAEDISSFAPSAKSIFTIKENKIAEISLLGHPVKDYTLDTQDSIEKILVTPTSNVALIFDSGNLAILTPEEHLLQIAEHVQRAGWSPDGQIIYYQTDPMSIHVYNAFNERLPYIPLHQSQLILRLSRPINEAQWFAGGHHLIYQTDDEIKITETDTRDYPVTFIVDSTDIGNCQCDVGTDGKNIFYLKKNGESNDLILAEISDKT